MPPGWCQQYLSDTIIAIRIESLVLERKQDLFGYLAFFQLLFNYTLTMTK